MDDSEKINQLILGIQKDDSVSFEALYNLYHKRVYAFALSLLNSTSNAEEIVQNVFLAIWVQRKSLNISSSFTSYLFSIVRYKVYDFIHQKINYEAFVKYSIEHNAEYSFVTDDAVSFNELEKRFQQAIKQLPRRRREIFILNRIEKLSYKEISERLDISENTVDTQIRHSLDFLRLQLGDYLVVILTLISLKQH
jgi:RNA polymerase sigma-70 factor (ECF subfamily)